MWDFRRSAWKTAAIERDGWETSHLSICDHMEQCGIPPFPCSHRLVWHPFENDVSFSCPLLPFPQPHWGVFMSLEMEGFWPSSTGPNIPPGCNGCWHHSWTIPGRIRHTNRFFPRCLAREDIRCDVDENMWPGRLDYIHLFYSSVGFFCLYIHIINGRYIAYFYFFECPVANKAFNAAILYLSSHKRFILWSYTEMGHYIFALSFCSKIN